MILTKEVQHITEHLEAINVAASKRYEAIFNLPHHLLSPRELAQAYAYALYKWGDSAKSRLVLDSIDRLFDEEEINGLKAAIEDLKNQIEYRNDDLSELEEKLSYQV